MASVGSKLYVFGGGLSGPDPIPDTTVHVFNAGECDEPAMSMVKHTLIYSR